MKNKKGFTLVELLAVIAILAILVIIALPNILNLYRNARENVFVEDAQSILRTAQQKYLEDSISSSPSNLYCNTGAAKYKLDVDAKSSLNYFIQFSDGKVTNYVVDDGNYRIEAKGADIKIEQLKNSKSEAATNVYPVTSGTTAKNVGTCPAE